MICNYIWNQSRHKCFLVQKNITTTSNVILFLVAFSEEFQGPAATRFQKGQIQIKFLLPNTKPLTYENIKKMNSTDSWKVT